MVGQRHKTVAYALLGLALALALGKVILPDAFLRLPDAMVVPFARWINAGFAFAQNELGLMKVTRVFAGLVEWMLDITANLLYGKNRWPRLGPIPWGVIAVTAGDSGLEIGKMRVH